ncbi:MAG: endonuclease/exonuclease/phosphatase family protein [Alphaproteobacteria bacterium]|nr:endonuclease/exonuclease/phosphatase family protein [Alphaproteobacteria bacterium]
MWLLALLAGCGNPVPSGTFVTYNAGLAIGFVPGANERTDAVAGAIATLDADVVCLQEVWTPGQVDAVKSAAGTAFPHSFFPDAQQLTEATPACPDGQLDNLLTCANDACSDACVDELPGCVQGGCPFQFIGLPTDCLRCTMANVGGEIADIAAACETQTTEYAYGGSFGTGILSKHPILSTDEHVFASTTNRRSALHAVIDLPSGPQDVYCTHLTAVFSTIPYPRPPGEGSWAEEQTTQIEELRDWIDSTATGPVVAMGDFNAGPAVGDIDAEQPANYDLLVGGYADPYIANDGRCTFCGDNPLVALGGDDRNSEIIDHVLFKGFEEPTYTAGRVLDGGIDTQTCGTDIAGAYSDHYGVSVTLNPE